MITEKFNSPHVYMSSALKEMIPGKRYQYKEGSAIYHFIFQGWDENDEYYTWYGTWDDGDLMGNDFNMNALKDMTGMCFGSMPCFMPENSYMCKWNRDKFQKNI